MQVTQVVVVLFLLLGGTSSAQVQTDLETDKDSIVTPIKDVSSLGSPIKITGEWRFKLTTSGRTEKLNYQEHLVATNVSAEKIVAYVVNIRVTGPTGPLSDENLAIDAFFQRTHELAPGQRFESRERHAGELSGDMSEIPSGRPVNPHAEAKVVFIQFEGGSTFGDATDPLAAEFLGHRAKTLAALQQLADAAAAEGTQEFEKALAVKQEDTQAEDTLESIRKVQRRNGTMAAVAKAKEMLAFAATRLRSQ